MKISKAQEQLNSTGVKRKDLVAEAYQGLPEKKARDMGMLPVLLWTAFNTAVKNDGVFFNEEAVRAVKVSAAVVLENRSRDERQKLQTILPQDAKSILMAADPVSGKEQVLMLCYAIMNLVESERVPDTGSQAVYMAIMILNEAQEYDEVPPEAESRLAKGAKEMLDRATFLGYF